MAIANRGNEYLQRQRLDNNLLSQHPEVCATTCLYALNLVYLLSTLVHPFMPSTDDDILRILDAPPRALPERPQDGGGYGQHPGKGLTIDLLPGHKIGKPFHLFSKIDAEKEEVWRKQFGGKQAGSSTNAAEVNGKSKRGAAKAAKAAKTSPAYTGPKTDEMIEVSPFFVVMIGN